MHGDPHIFQSIHHIAENPDKVGYCSLNAESAWFDCHNSAAGGCDIGFEWGGFIAHVEANPLRFGHLIEYFKAFRLTNGVKMYDAAQFAVSRERIRAHPLAFYQELLDWLTEPNPGYDHERCSMLENYWHYLFGEAPALPHPRGRCANLYGLDHAQ